MSARGSILILSYNTPKTVNCSCHNFNQDILKTSSYKFAIKINRHAPSLIQL